MVAVYCAGHGRLERASELASALFLYLMDGSHLTEALAIYTQLLPAARQAGDVAAEARAHNGLGAIGSMKGHPAEAIAHFQAALPLHRQRGDRGDEAQVLRNIAAAERQLSDNHRASGHLHQAIAAFAELDRPLDVAQAMTELASIEAELGQYDEAADHLERAITEFRQATDEGGEARALSGLGEIKGHRGDLAAAAECFEQALAVFQRLQHPASAAAQLCNLGELRLRGGDYGPAVGYFRQAHALFGDAGFQYGELFALRYLGLALQGSGQGGAARTELTAALALAIQTGNTFEQAMAHHELAGSFLADDAHDQARLHWEEALPLFTQLGLPVADQVRKQLSELPAVSSASSGQRRRV